MSMYPQDLELNIYGEKVLFPGLKDGKFSNGDLNNFSTKPSYIDATTINLLVDNLMGFIEKTEAVTNNYEPDQLSKTLSSQMRPSKIIIRTSEGTAEISDPINPLDIMNKRVMDAAVADLTEKLTTMDTNIRDNIGKDLEDLETRVNEEIGVQLADLEKTVKEDIGVQLDNLEDRVNNEIGVKLDALEQTVIENETDIENKLAELKATVSMNETDIEEKVSDLESLVSTNETDIEKKVSDLEDLVSTNETDIEKKVTSLTSLLTSNETDIENKVKALSSLITDNEADIENKLTDLEDLVSTNETDIEKKVSNLTSTLTSHNHDSSYLKLTGGKLTGALTTNSNITSDATITGNKVVGLVWNDLVDFVDVPDNFFIQYGKAYVFKDDEFETSSSYNQKGLFGIASDTFGMSMGQRCNSQMPIAVAGYVLAYCDKIYESGTPLTCTENGYLTEMSLNDKRDYPERLLGTFWKVEKAEKWNGIRVDNRSWVKLT